MSVTIEEVTWAYRMLLGREPESPEAMAVHLSIADRPGLRAAFLGSKEFRDATQQGLPIGRYIGEVDIDVQVHCSPSERDRMLAQIGREWTRFGELEPHWSVLVSDRFSAANIGQHLDEFYATGHGDVDQVIRTVQRATQAAPELDRVLDYGCGVGRMTLAMAARAKSVTGIDVSPPHLELARQRAQQAGIDNVEFVPVRAVEDLDLQQGYDLVFSLIVLQHNPPPVMAALFERLLGCLRPGGIAMIQLPTYLSGYRFNADRYFAEAQASMEMNYLPQPYIFEIIHDQGCIPLEVREDGRIGEGGLSHLFTVRKR